MAHDGARSQPHSAAGALTALSISVLLASLGTSSSNVALPTLARFFDASFEQVQWIVLAYLLAITTLVVSVGRLGDLLGRRRLLIGGLSLFTSASVACGLASNLATLIVARAAQGLGAACMMALATALVGETAAKGKGGAAMGLLGAMSAVGTALGPTLGGALISAIGWPAIYHVNAPLGLVAAVLSHRFLPADAPRPEARKGFDHVGTLLLAAVLAAYSLSMTTGRGSFGLISGALLVGAGSLFGLFVWTEFKVRSPLIDVALFRAPGLGAGFFMSACVTTVVMASLVVGPFYLSEALGLSAAAVGAVMSCGPLVAALAGVPAGRIVDRCGAGRVTTWGLIVAAAGCAAIASAPRSLGTAGYVLPLAVITAGYAIFQAANNTAVMTSVGAERKGVVSGLLNLSRNLGLITGASAMGAVFNIARSVASGAADPIEAASDGMRLTFWVATLLILISVRLSLRLRSGRSVVTPPGAGL